MQSEREFMKIMDNRYAISVLIHPPMQVANSTRIIHTKNKIMLLTYQDDHVSMPSSEAEFEAAYKQVQKYLKQFFDVKQS